MANRKAQKAPARRVGRPPAEIGPNGKRETPKRRQRREEIYDVAIAIFNKKGYASASMQDIADEIGVLKGSLYYYIDSKEDLLEGIFTQADQEFMELIEEALALDVSEVERLRSFARAWCLWYLQNIERARIYVNDWDQMTGKRRKSVARARREYGEQVQGIIDRAVEEIGLESDVDSHWARLYVFSAINGLPMWYRRNGESSPEEISVAYAELIIRTVLCSGSAELEAKSAASKPVKKRRKAARLS
ncbi:MAG: TetR family transcriptional regulator [Actinobacteria bacterium]|nr:TetR family transcriptional regulator [Actinomycetota bacterium]